MKKSILIGMIFMAIIAILTVSSCIYDPNNQSNGNNVVPGNGDSKIVSIKLSKLIEDANEGDIINLQKYNNLEVEDNLIINKSVTIMNGSLQNSTLIAEKNIVLTNVHNGSVNTDSSLKISDSKLNNLNINSSLSESNGSQIVGRGNSTESKQPPLIEISNSTVSNLDVGIKKTFVKAEKLTSTKVVMAAEDTQLSVLDKDSEIKGISFSKPCQIILEDGSNDKIAAPKATNSAAGEAVQIKMKSSMSLIRLAVASGIPSVIMEGTIPDFSSLTVYGTYSATDGVTVYKSGDFCYDGAKQFTKLESQFTVKIGGVVYFENGNKASTAVPLGEGEKTVTISIAGVENPKYEFSINVVKSEPVLTGVSIKNASNILKNIYKSGEKLNLKGLIVEGNYTYEGEEYSSVITGWTSEPEDGEILNSSYTGLTVRYGEMSDSVESVFTVFPTLTFTFVPDVNNEHYNFMQFVIKDETAEEPSAFTLEGYEGYEFLGWWTSHNNGVTLDATYDFSASVKADTKVYAKWNKPIERKSDDGDENTEDQTPDTQNDPINVGTYRIIFNGGEGEEYDGTMDTIDVSCDVTIDLPECAFIMLHYTFGGWNTRKDGKGTSYADKSGVVNLAAAGETVTLWAQWDSAEKYRIIYHPDEISDTAFVQVIYADSTGDELMIKSPSVMSINSEDWTKAGYYFFDWVTDLNSSNAAHYSPNPISQDLTGDGGEFHLYAMWVEDDSSSSSEAAGEDSSAAIGDDSSLSSSTTGDDSASSATGNDSSSATAGDDSSSASMAGDASSSSSTEDYSSLASTAGDDSSAVAATGDSSSAASATAGDDSSSEAATGDDSSASATATGDSSSAATTGDDSSSSSSTTGDDSSSSATGDDSSLASTAGDDSSSASTTGDDSSSEG